MDHQLNEDLLSISQAAADVQRLVLNIALSQRLGVDWRMDMIRAGERIAAVTRKLGETK